MKNTKKHLKFIKRINNPNKTEIVEVYLIDSNDFLGTIHWRNGWRCYVISYADNIDMSLSCNKELTKFMEQLESEVKKSWKK
jgi:hypothetical protein